MFIPKVIVSKVYPKKNETPKDCNDRIEHNLSNYRFCVADGATRSFYSSIWAALLVKYFCSQKFDNKILFKKKDWKKWLIPIQKKWRKIVKERVAKNNKYFLVNRLNQRESAVSTFAGLEFHNKKGFLSWQAMIIGDTCLFHIKSNQSGTYSIERHLLKDASQFDSFPDFFASYEKDNRYEPTFLKGKCHSGDYFVIATDALSQWIMSYLDINKLFPLPTLRKISKKTLEELRENKDVKLENDDVAIIVIKIQDVDTSPAGQIEKTHQEKL